MNRKKKKMIVLFAILILCFAALSSFYYINDYYHSEADMQQYLQKDETVKVTEIKEGLYLDGLGTDTAIVFYPGAKVEYTAYLPLLYKLAEQGVDCFLIKMPYNLAIFGQNKAENILKQYNYERWFLSGHSLGGAMAASFASENLEKLNGLILLAAYSIKDLKAEYFSVISLYGSEDQVLKMDKVIQSRELMPLIYEEVCIEGGNHAYFGNYGEQKGDGTATINCEQQQAQATEKILQFIERQKEVTVTK